MLNIALSLAAAGVASHVFYFNRGEHHMWSPAYTQISFLSFCGIVATLVKFYKTPLLVAVLSTAFYTSCYLAGLLTSLIIYRVWFSPLSKFPGPWQARISSLYVVSHIRKFDGYLYFEKLHERYGKYVRIGSNDLSISDADLHDLAFAAKNPFPKADWYDNSVPFTSMHTSRDQALHARRRKLWVPAFSDKALRDYEPKVKAYNDKLVDRIQEHVNGPVNVSKWVGLWSFDVMGQLAFGKDYNMLVTGERHWALDLLVEGMSAASPRTPTWLFRILINIPFAARGFYKFLNFCRDEIQWRIDNGGVGKDITGWLLKAYEGFEKPADDPFFTADSRLMVVAGSDTTAATVTFLLYELAKRPDEVRKLREELKPLTNKEWSDVDIRHAPHLNGAINEALRLHPPVPSGVQRQVPKGGVTINGVYLPEDTQFWMPQYVLGRDGDNYEDPLEFIPERWYSEPSKIKHKNAFAPFSLGPQGCIGKNLAYLEVRTLITALLLRFDIALAPGEDGKQLLYLTKDHFTLGLEALSLVFTPASS